MSRAEHYFQGFPHCNLIIISTPRDTKAGSERLTNVAKGHTACKGGSSHLTPGSHYFSGHRRAGRSPRAPLGQHPAGCGGIPGSPPAASELPRGGPIPGRSSPATRPPRITISFRRLFAAKPCALCSWRGGVRALDAGAGLGGWVPKIFCFSRSIQR